MMASSPVPRPGTARRTGRSAAASSSTSSTAQIIAAYLAQIGLPVLAGAVAGTLLGGQRSPPGRHPGPGADMHRNTSYFRLLALVVAVLAGLGVLNSVLMATRERAHDLGVFKAVGMTPRQTIAMVTWAATAKTTTALRAE